MNRIGSSVNPYNIRTYLYSWGRTQLPVTNILFVPSSRLRSLSGTSVCPFPPFGRRSLRFESIQAFKSLCFKIKKSPALTGDFSLAGVGLGFQSQTSCLLLTTRLRSLSGTSCALFAWRRAHSGSSPYRLKKEFDLK